MQIMQRELSIDLTPLQDGVMGKRAGKEDLVTQASIPICLSCPVPDGCVGSQSPLCPLNTKTPKRRRA